jgi:uncharacterized OB-fold protein
MPEQIPSAPFEGDGDSRPFWEGIAQGELRIQRCASCSRYVFYPRALCPHCHSDRLSWAVASGKGSIYSYTVAHHATGAPDGEVPFVVALVELEEGVRMMTRILGAPRERIKIDAPVRLSIESLADGPALPYFRLVDEV